jgi:hypothetical protein
MNSTTAVPTGFRFPFFTFKNITSPEDRESERTVLAGQAPIQSVLDLPTDENVRDYLLEAEGKKRRKPTQVHRAIRDTLENMPQNFSILNGGVVIVARGYDVDDKQKTLLLRKPSIINGSQTQGVIRDYLSSRGDTETPPIHVKFELIITDDDSLIAETSIARNFQNDVMTVSIVGRLGQLDELEQALQDRYPDSKLRKSETKVARKLSLSEDYVLTEKLLQVITALTPEELWFKPGESDNPVKTYTYSAKAKCLKDFQRVYERAHDRSDPEYAKYRGLYQFYLDIAPQALYLYDTWKAHQGFAGTGIRAIEREGRQIKEVPDGIVFPILAALSAFATKTDAGWRIVPPKEFQDEELIRAAKSAYQDLASSNPGTMGKSKACYAQLYQITTIYKRLLDGRSAAS